MDETQSSNDSRPRPDSAVDETTLLERISDTFTLEANHRAFARDILADFARQVLDGTILSAKDAEAMVKARIVQLCALIFASLTDAAPAPECQGRQDNITFAGPADGSPTEPRRPVDRRV